MSRDKLLKCECCGVAWNNHDNILQTCKKVKEMKNENQKLKEELKNLRNKLEVAADAR